MIRYFIRTCDFCKEETANFDGSLIIKERWIYFDGSAGWHRKDICPKCASKLRKAMGQIDDIDEIVEGSII